MRHNTQLFPVGWRVETHLINDHIQSAVGLLRNIKLVNMILYLLLRVICAFAAEGKILQSLKTGTQRETKTIM